MPQGLTDVLVSWNREGRLSGQKERWRIVPACVWWTKWRERNQRCFEDKQCSNQKLRVNCLVLYYFWCKQEYKQDIFDVLDNM